MPYFNYKAIGRNGKALSGSVEADGLELASRQLRGKGFTLLKLEARDSGSSISSVASISKSPNRQEILSLTSELAVLLRAGLPLDRALKILMDMATQPRVNHLLSSLLSSVKGGKSFSQALLPYEQVFGGFYVNMIRSGEAGGNLSEILARLVEYLESAKTNRDTVISALIYPGILAVVALLSILVMLGFVVPQFEVLFEDMGDALPPLTRMVVSGADILKSYGWLILCILVGVGFYLRSWMRTSKGIASIHRNILKIPLVGGIIFEFEVSKFARTAGTLLGNGVSLLKAISIAIDTVDNRVINDSLRVLPPAVKAGKRMSFALEETKMFTPMIIQIIRVGEESGSVDKMLLELAKVFDGHVQSGVKRGLALLEPVMILGMGFIIAVIIIAILMGILSVNDLAV